ncbi:MAG: hypothetical protein HWN65_20105 [Candidatus Helarchaeota archaeon]|nr:hypothetical protein [Candidatus Helarchaeota archaeon]
MVYLVNNVWYPSDKSPEVGKKYIEVLKKFPPDKSLGKTLLVMVRPTKEGIHVIGIGKIAKGKLEENILRTTKSNEEFTDIDGFTYEIQTFLDYTEAYQVIDMKPPEEI